MGEPGAFDGIVLDVWRRAMNNVDFDRSSSTALVDARSIAGLQRQQKLLDLCLFAVDRCLRGGAAIWWRQGLSLPLTDIAKGVEHLKELCLRELLYDSGDARAARRIYEILEE